MERICQILPEAVQRSRTPRIACQLGNQRAAAERVPRLPRGVISAQAFRFEPPGLDLDMDLEFLVQLRFAFPPAEAADTLP